MKLANARSSLDECRLQEEANKHRAATAAAAVDASAVKRARFQATIDAAQLARFQSALGDGLLFGTVGILPTMLSLHTRQSNMHTCL